MSYGYFYHHALPSIIRQIRKIKKFHEPKFYAVAVGRRVGIYRSWPSCKVQIDNISNAKYRRFDTHNEAIAYLEKTPIETPLPLQDHELLTKTTKFDHHHHHDDDNIEMTSLDSDSSSIVYIDGSCWRNGAPDACAGIGIYWPGSPEQNQSLTIDGRQTSIRAEIWAAIYALRQAKQLGLNEIIIYSDSHFVIQTATVWLYKWKRNCWMTSSGSEVKNRYDMMALDESIRQMKKVIWRSVPGHSGVPGNEEADRLANAAIADQEQQQQQQQQQQRITIANSESIIVNDPNKNENETKNNVN
ncbi:ribonuclease H1 [Dermatophagoides farinae]|uniref:ribonuclease H1 n=1 Tax=Dermatophagoides farinae TaxID=6954 RepID=UPI003F5E8B8D